MWKSRWENLVFSSRAWKRNTRYVGRLLERQNLLDSPILMVGKEYFPHPDYRSLNYSVFIHHNMRLAMDDGVTPWLPPKRDVERFLELETLLYRHARHIFVGAQFLADSLVKNYGVKEDHITIAGGGPHPYFEAHPVEEVARSFTNQIIFVGWDFGMKGGQDLLQAFAIAHKSRPELTLVIAGPDESQWTNQPGVRWLGPVRSKDELIRLYRGSDLFVMPSLRDSFGFVFLEAMSQGVPCIGTDINAMPEIIQNGKTGFVVPRRNPRSLAEAILKFYDRIENRHEMGTAALRHVQRNYTWSRVAELLMQKMCG
jgi:glycosyltransferase involved in cell wall biosynthesis